MRTDLKPPPIGALRRRLVLEAPGTTPDGVGGSGEDWTTVAIVWAAIHPRFGSEYVQADRLEGRVTHDIWVRPRSDFAPGQRLRHEARVFDIRAVLRPDPYVNRMRLVCEERDQ